MVNIGDKVVITKLNGVILESPQVATVEDVGESWFDIEEEINGESTVFKDDDGWDIWYNADSPDSLIDVEKVKKGSSVIVTRVNGIKLMSPKRVSVIDVTLPIIKIHPEINGESLIYAGGHSLDSWHIVDEDTDEDTDEDKIMPNYIELASGGMTFSEFAGEDITAESLNFRPYDDKVNHPNHYNKYSREVIESIKGLCTPDEFRGYLKGNIIKYSARYSDKDGIQDIDKLAKYTQFLKEFELEMAELSEEE